MKKINVAYVSHENHMRMGAQNSMAFLIENLDRERFNPSCIMPSPGELSERLEKAGCPCHYIPLPHLKPKNYKILPSVVRNIRKYIRENDIDIIHPDFEADVFLCGIAKRNTKAKMIWHVRLTTQYAKDMIHQRLADGFIGISEGTRARFSKSRIISDKFRVIYNGVDCDVFTPLDGRGPMREKLGIPKDRFVLLFVGQIKPGKGIFDLANAAVILKNDKEIKEMPCIIYIGSPKNRDEFNYLKSIIADNGLSEDVIIVPQQKNINEWMQSADALILPSHEQVEGMGRVLFEAMACGAAAIGSDTSGVREAVSPESGLLVREKSPEDIAEKVKMLVNDSDLLRILQTNGRQRALEHFNIKNHAREVEKFYLEILKK